VRAPRPARVSLGHGARPARRGDRC
jgi:hypothetical protein